MNNKMKMLAGLFMCSATLFLGSCAEGSDEEAAFLSEVRNQQLVSPELGKGCFSTITAADGSENVKFTWPLVKGAGGYKVNIGIVDGDKVEPIVTDQFVDGLSLLFPKSEDTKYEVSVIALGNEKLNNTGATEASKYLYSTMVDGVEVPAGDIAAFINGYLAEHKAEIEAAVADDPNNYELGFTLKEGTAYTMEAPVEFGVTPIVLQGADKNNRPTVTVGESGYLCNQTGLKVKYINFDCTGMKAYGLLMFGEHVDEFSTEALGYKNIGGNQDCWVMNKQVMFKGCMVKGLANSFIYSNDKNWALRDLRIDDCIIQMSNTGSKSFIDLCANSSGKGGIKDLTLRNSTIMNLVDNENSYFIRLANASNAQAQKIWGTGNRNTLSFENLTIVKVMSNKNFADRYVNSASVCDVAIKGCIFYDTWRIQKLIGNNQQSIQPTDNTIWGIKNPVDNTDATKYATEEDPAFTGPFLQELDLSAPNGGINLHAAGTLSSTMGDPRWR